MVAAYIADHASALKVSPLTRQLAVISIAHEAKGLPNPAASPLVRATMRGIRRERGSAQRQAKPLLSDHLFAVLAVMVGDATSSRAPLLHGHYSASPLLRTRPPPSRLRSTSRLRGLYDLPCSGDFAPGRGGLLQLLGMSLPPCCRFHPAEVKEPLRSDFRLPMLPSPSSRVRRSNATKRARDEPSFVRSAARSECPSGRKATASPSTSCWIGRRTAGIDPMRTSAKGWAQSSRGRCATAHWPSSLQSHTNALEVRPKSALNAFCSYQRFRRRSSRPPARCGSDHALAPSTAPCAAARHARRPYDLGFPWYAPKRRRGAEHE